MDIQSILDKYGKDFKKILSILEDDPIKRDVSKWQDQYDGKHIILEKEDKLVGPKGEKKFVKAIKNVITLQKKVVSSAVSFLFGEPVKLILNSEDKETFDLINNVWITNKLKYFNKKLARKVFVETKVAELWYVKKLEGQEAKIKVVLLCKSNGDEIYAHFDDLGDMDAFLRKYSLDNIDGKSEDHADIYLETKTIQGVNKQGGWETVDVPNMFEKIPVIYYSQNEPEWKDVQTEIDRIEDLLSKFGDTNDYFGSPILKLKGEIENPPTKEEVGKILRFKGSINDKGDMVYSGDADYLTWEQAPESIKMEYDMLKDIIYGMTSTPDLSFNNVKGLSSLSGIAIKLMFTDSILKAKDKEELFGECLTRRNNLLKAIVSTVSVKHKIKLEELDISLEFGSVLPTDLDEIIKSLSLARGGEPIMSEETAVRQNPLVPDADADIESMGKEKESLPGLGESFEV